MTDIAVLTLDEAIVQFVTEMQGCKMIEAVVSLSQEYHGQDVALAIERLIRDKKLVAVNYVLPTKRTKTFLLPMGTEVT
jgi:hypothetical protein